MKQRQTGFTLLELMIVVGLIAVLASIAMPAYTDYVTRSKIADATSALAQGQVAMEQYFQDNRTYAGGPCPAATPYFGFGCAADANTFTITATGTSTGGTSGFVYTIDQAGAKATTGVASGWTSNASCWVTRKDGGC